MSVKGIKKRTEENSITLTRSNYWDTEAQTIDKINKLLREHVDFRGTMFECFPIYEIVCSGCGKPWEPEALSLERALDGDAPETEGKLICAYCGKFVEE